MTVPLGGMVANASIFRPSSHDVHLSGGGGCDADCNSGRNEISCTMERFDQFLCRMSFAACVSGVNLDKVEVD